MKQGILLVCLFLPAVLYSAGSIPSVIGYTTIADYFKNPVEASIKFLFEDTQFVASFPRGLVINEGGILTHEGLVLRDTETYREDQHGLLKGAMPDAYLFVEGSVAVISSPGQENWYHWLLQVLPRLKILVESGVHFDKIYVNNLKYSWQKESLEMVCKLLNVSQDMFLLIEDNVVVQAETLIVPSAPFIPAKHRKQIPLWFKEFLQALFYAKSMKKNTHKKYIFLAQRRDVDASLMKVVLFNC